MTFDFSQEYRRAAHILRGSQNSKAVFLRCYALYLAGEKRKEEERIELSGTLGKAETTNKVTARLLLSTTVAPGETISASRVSASWLHPCACRM